MNNGEWFNSLTNEEKATVLHIIRVTPNVSLQEWGAVSCGGMFWRDWFEWLNSPHRHEPRIGEELHELGLFRAYFVTDGVDRTKGCITEAEAWKEWNIHEVEK
jgi:hypothetical protein